MILYLDNIGYMHYRSNQYGDIARYSMLLGIRIDTRVSDFSAVYYSLAYRNEEVK